MAVGKGSMERASKAADKTAAEKKTTTRKPRAKKAVTKEVTQDVIASPSPEVLEAIVYQESSQVLDRNAEPNERFGVGESMPIYFY